MDGLGQRRHQAVSTSKKKANYIISSGPRHTQALLRSKTFRNIDENQAILNTKSRLHGPKPEQRSIYTEDRKQIIFNKLNFKESEHLLKTMIVKSQKKVDHCSQQVIHGKKFFFMSELDKIHNLVTSFCECTANYGLGIFYYFKNNQRKKAHELFLLFHQINSSNIDLIVNKIETEFPKGAPFNNISRYYPIITKLLAKSLACMLKLSTMFNTYPIENFYIIKFLQINAVIFCIYNYKPEGKELEYENRTMGRFIYGEALNDIACFCTSRFFSFKVPIELIGRYIKIFNYELKEFNKSFRDINIIEQSLILKSYFNISIFYYLYGNSNEAMIHLTRAKEKIQEIRFFPFIERIKENSDSRFSKIFLSDAYGPDIISSDNSFAASFSMIRRRGFSSHSAQFENAKTYYTSVLYYNNDIMVSDSKSDKIQDLLRYKISKEIEFLACEIELDQKNYFEAFKRINKILFMNPFFHHKVGLIQESPSQNPLLSSPKKLSSTNATSISGSKNEKLLKNVSNLKKSISKRTNKIFCGLLGEDEQRKIALFLERIESDMVEILTYRKNKKSRIVAMKDLEEDDLFYFKNNKAEIKISTEIQKFFLFVCSLSAYQIKMLNDFQPKDIFRRNDLPIMFPIQFKDCLNYYQRLNLENLDTLSLSRYVVLRDPYKNISTENFDYEFGFFNNKTRGSLIKQMSLPTTESAYNKNPKLSRFTVTSYESERIKEKKKKKEDLIINNFKIKFDKYEDKKYIEEKRDKLVKLLPTLKPEEITMISNDISLLKTCLQQIEEIEGKIKKRDMEILRKNRKKIGINYNYSESEKDSSSLSDSEILTKRYDDLFNSESSNTEILYTSSIFSYILKSELTYRSNNTNAINAQ